MFYRKKPVIIEAVQWTGDNRKEIFDFCEKSFFSLGNGSSDIQLKISTLEGIMTASIGDYIIKDVDGKFYLCKPDIFKKTYEFVETKEK